MTSLPTEASAERTRIDRRQAMKAAVGGAAAAAALAGPRIQGFSVVPDFAAASSQCKAGSTTNGTPILTRTSVSGGFQNKSRCWGTSGGSSNGQTCTSNIAVAGTTTIPVTSPNFTAPTVTATVGGEVSDDNGRLDVTLSNFTVNKPFASCTVVVTGTCTNGSFKTLIPSTIRTAGGTFGGLIRCTAQGNQPQGTVNISTSCICGPD